MLTLLSIVLLYVGSNSNAEAFHQAKQNLVGAAPTKDRGPSNSLASVLSLRGGAIFRPFNAKHHADRDRDARALPVVPPPVAVAFDNAPLQRSCSIFLVTNAFGFAMSLVTGSHRHLDLLGTGAFALVALPALRSPACTRTALSSAAVLTWGAKLAAFLFFRALKVKTDGRLDDTLSTVGEAFGFWFVSLVWGIVCSLPHTLGTTSSNPGNTISLAVGGTVFLLGLVTETKADLQKWLFKRNHPGQFCTEGLWSISKHPNFFGNLLVWVGILILNADSLLPRSAHGGETAKRNILATVWDARRLILAAFSLLFMWTVFSAQASGTITNVVKLANGREDPVFREYITNVPMIIPNVILWAKALLFG